MPHHTKGDRARTGFLSGATTGASIAGLLSLSFSPAAIIAGGVGIIGLLGGLFSRDPEEPEEQKRRETNKLASAIGPVRWILGERRVPGKFLFAYQSGNEADPQWLWFEMGNDPMEGISAITMNGIMVPLVKETIPVEYPNTDAEPLRGVLARHRNQPGDWRAGSRRYVIFAGARPVPDDLFLSDGQNASIRSVSWVFDDADLDSFNQRPSVAFGDSTHGGFAPGPNMLNPGRYSIILRTGGRTERMPLASTDPTDPHDFLLNQSQIDWLIGIGSSEQPWDVALIDTRLFPSRDWEDAFRETVTLQEETGALVPGADWRVVGDSELPDPYLRVFPFFDADGQVPQVARDAAPAFWTDDHRLPGISWALVQLNNVDRPRPAGLHPSASLLNPGMFEGFAKNVPVPPDFEFVVRGVKPKLPWQREPRWTQNSAALLYWVLTERLGIPPDAFDHDALAEAVAICDERLHYDLPGHYAPNKPTELEAFPSGVIRRPGGGEEPIYQGYRQDSTRYSLNGVIFADDFLPGKVDETLAEMFLSLMGTVNSEGGAYTILPGKARAPKWIIGPDDLVEPPEVQRDISGGRQIGGVKMSLEQSRDHEWTPISMPGAFDSRIVRGEVVDIGSHRFITDPLQAGRILKLALSKAKRDRSVVVRFSAGEHMERLAIREGDLVRLIAPTISEAGDAWVLTSPRLMDDGTIRAILRPDLDWDTGEFSAPPLPVGVYAGEGTEYEPPVGPVDPDEEEEPSGEPPE